MMTVGVYFLIIDNTKKESYAAGFKYILMMFTGGLFILVAALMLYNLTGSFELAVIAKAAPYLPATTLQFIFGLFETRGKTVKEKIVLWEDTCPSGLIITLWEERGRRKHPKSLPEKGYLGIKNVWDIGNGTIEAWHSGAAMIVEEIENGRRYHCNDGHPDENFDDIVFTIQKVRI